MYRYSRQIQESKYSMADLILFIDAGKTLQTHSLQRMSI